VGDFDHLLAGKRPGTAVLTVTIPNNIHIVDNIRRESLGVGAADILVGVGSGGSRRSDFYASYEVRTNGNELSKGPRYCGMKGRGGGRCRIGSETNLAKTILAS
jgi:hypothetical protein